jgi:ribonuclease T2
MLFHRIRRAVETAAIAFSFTFVFAVVALAQNAAPAKTGEKTRDFDFYVLSLSWSPTYCENAKERARERSSNRRPTLQCSGKPFAFIVHGLWPQYAHGYPTNCQRPAPRIDRTLVSGMLDLMPSRPLIYAEWNRHGTCSGLDAQGYFDTVRKARAAVKVPIAYHHPTKTLSMSPTSVIAAFVNANPGLPAKAVTISCRKSRLTEVRLCLNKDLSFRECGSIGRACRRGQIVMPAVRGE